MVNTKDWLPIGSVVHIAGRDGLVSIIASMVGDEASKTLWDYAAVPYPQGLTGQGRDIMFNKDAIDGVLGLGFVNADGERMESLLRQAEQEFEKRKAEQTS